MRQSPVRVQGWRANAKSSCYAGPFADRGIGGRVDQWLMGGDDSMVPVSRHTAVVARRVSVAHGHGRDSSSEC